MKRNLFCRKKNKAWFLMLRRKKFAKKLKRDKHFTLFQSSPKLNHTLITRMIRIQWKPSRLLFLLRYPVFSPNCPKQYSNTLDQPTKITKKVVEYNVREEAILHKLNLQKFSSTHYSLQNFNSLLKKVFWYSYGFFIHHVSFSKYLLNNHHHHHHHNIF